MKYILIDNGHGINTPGKCSPLKPDGNRYYEWKWTREAARMMAEKIRYQYKDVEPVLLVTENFDVSLAERVKRANSYIKKYGAKNCVFVSVHSNAAPGNGWSTASGWSIWTTKGQNNSDKLAQMMYDEAKLLLEPDEEYKSKLKVRKDNKDGDADYESNFYVIRYTDCPAVLVENLFHNNKEDVEYLESFHGKDVLTDIMINGCYKYLKSKNETKNRKKTV